MREHAKRPGAGALLTLALALASAHVAAAQQPTLVWSDEFDGPRGARVDKKKWKAEIGGGGWGNNERQYYTKKGAFMDGEGSLVIEAAETKRSQNLSCWYGRCRYTSARLITKGKFEVTYGRIEARIKVPFGQGIWPAFWMLGKDIDRVGWPQSGEIDVMEHIGREPTKAYGTLHGPGYSGANGLSAEYSLPDAGRFADDFHVFAVEWEPEEIRWYVDGTLYSTKRPSDLPSGAKWVYDHPFFLLLNVAVGGFWPGEPDATSTYPQRMLVDYVRVYDLGQSPKKE